MSCDKKRDICSKNATVECGEGSCGIIALQVNSDENMFSRFGYSYKQSSAAQKLAKNKLQLKKAVEKGCE